MKIGRDGQMTLGLVVTLTFFFVVGLAILSLRFDLRRQVQNQRRLDQCIQKKVTRLLGTQKKIEWGNLRIEAERLTYEATKVIQPQIAIAARIAMELEVLYQKGLLAEWDLTRTLWVKDQGCDGKSDFPLPLPSLKWKRLPPDGTGPPNIRAFSFQFSFLSHDSSFRHPRPIY